MFLTIKRWWSSHIQVKEFQCDARPLSASGDSPLDYCRHPLSDCQRLEHATMVAWRCGRCGGLIVEDWKKDDNVVRGPWPSDVR
jgi:hypothetical protein